MRSWALGKFGVVQRMMTLPSRNSPVNRGPEREVVIGKFAVKVDDVV